MTTPTHKDRDLDGKPTITNDDHAENFGQREDVDHEGTKPTITSDNHNANIGQRCGYHDHKAEPESRK